MEQFLHLSSRRSKWRLEHPQYNKNDPYYLLTRQEQVTVFRIRAGHNHLNYHLYSKLRIGHTEQCPCGTGSQTTEHLLQSCSHYGLLRKGIWPHHTPIDRKLYVSLGDLRCTDTFWRLEFPSYEREGEEGSLKHDLNILALGCQSGHTGTGVICKPHPTGQQRTEKVGGLWQRATSCSGRTQPRIG